MPACRVRGNYVRCCQRRRMRGLFATTAHRTASTRRLRRGPLSSPGRRRRDRARATQLVRGVGRRSVELARSLLRLASRRLGRPVEGLVLLAVEPSLRRGRHALFRGRNLAQRRWQPALARTARDQSRVDAPERRIARKRGNTLSSWVLAITGKADRRRRGRSGRPAESMPRSRDRAGTAREVLRTDRARDRC